jgi:hypothetical protein
MSWTGWKAEGTWKPSPEQLEYRRQEIARLWQEGCTAEQIRSALRPPVGKTTIWKDLDAMGVTRIKRYKGLTLDPPPVHWENPPRGILSPEPVDRVALAARHFLRELHAARYESAHANDLLDARNRNDRGWQARWLHLIGELQQVTATLAAQHDADGGGGLRAAINGWAQESHGGAVADSPAMPAALASLVGRFGPPGFGREVQELVIAGQSLPRGQLAERYRMGQHAVQLEHQRAVGRWQVISAGWRPPPDVDTLLSPKAEAEVRLAMTRIGEGARQTEIGEELGSGGGVVNATASRKWRH